MELVEGEDLAERIARGPLPVDEALAIARQIAEALEAAHDARHRPSRPEAGERQAARRTARSRSSTSGSPRRRVGREARRAGDCASSPTITSPAMTQAGVILGTAAYMSPEQARGQPVDQRADIWAFGCVLYEMLTGRPAFDGETVTDVLGSIVKSEPDWDAAARRHAARRCGVCCGAACRRTPRAASRYRRCAGRARWPVERRHRRVGAAAAAGACAGAAACPGAAMLFVAGCCSAGYYARRRRHALLKVQMRAPPDVGFIAYPVISPDGRKIVYVARSRLWVQGLDEWDPDAARRHRERGRPFWSPDSQWIAYFRSELILKVPAAGGPVVRVGSHPGRAIGLRLAVRSWSEDGTIARAWRRAPCFAYPPPAVTPTPFPLAPPRESWICTMSSGCRRYPARHGPPSQRPRRRRCREGRHAAYRPRSDRRSPPGLLSHGTSDLRASQPELRHLGRSLFDRRLEVTGEPFVISPGVEPSIARNGTLSFVRQTGDQPRQLAWFSSTVRWVRGSRNRGSGRKESRFQGQPPRSLPRPERDCGSFDVETGTRSRLTTNPSDIMPEWVDDQRIVFVRGEAGEPVPDAQAVAVG